MALRTDEFRRQHQGILTIAKALAARCKKASTPEASLETRRLLSELAGNLRVHLAMEDGHLYPQLMRSNNPRVAELARRYYDEMGGVREVFDRYLKRWHSARAIALDPALFCSETLQIVEAVERRIEREDNELYPLVDNLSDDDRPRPASGRFGLVG